MSAGDPPLPFKAPRPIGPFTVFLRPPPEGWTGIPRLTVCVNLRPENGIAVSCAARGSEAIAAALRDAVAARGLALEIDTFRCLGMCEKGPAVRLTPGNNWFFGVKPEHVAELLDTAVKHFGLAPGQ
jgi:NADH:ubiquinone oxidoreductase subunit E